MRGRGTDAIEIGVAEAALLETIRTAFAGVPRGSVTVHEAEVIDSYGGSDEMEAARSRDTESTWEDVPDDSIRECPNALCYLDPEGWRFYIPVYMTWSVKHFRHDDSIVSDFTIYACALSDNPGLRQYKMSRYSVLSMEQERAVCNFLRFMAANGDHADDVVAREALQAYWADREPRPLQLDATLTRPETRLR